MSLKVFTCIGVCTGHRWWVREVCRARSSSSCLLDSRQTGRSRSTHTIFSRSSTRIVSPAPGTMQRMQTKVVCFLVIGVAFLLSIQVSQAQRSSFPFSKVLNPSSANHEDSEDSIDGESRDLLAYFVREGESWMRGLDHLSNRIFQIAREENHWPTLELGWRTIAGVILGGLGAALSSAGGIGGGGLFVPLFNLLLQFDPKTSAALSNFMILGGSFANLYMNLQQHHPTVPNKPLIDFDVVVLLQPNMLLGISAGVILNIVLPSWAITGLLIITLSYMAIHSFKGASRRWKKESCQNRQRKLGSERTLYGCSSDNLRAPKCHPQHSNSEECSSTEGGEHIPSVGKDNDDEENQKSGSKDVVLSKASESAKSDSLAEPLLEHEETCDRPVLPFDQILVLFLTWLAFFAIQLLRGGKGNESILGFSACGWGYWILTAAQIPLAFGVTGWTIHRLRVANPCKDHEDFMQEDGFTLRPESCAIFAWMALMTGLVGGLLGIGGGMIINPLLLAVGMIPQVTAGTCASMVFFSSSMSVVQYWLMGRVPITYALAAAVLCAIFSVLGITLLHRAIEKYNRASLIVFAVAIVMGISAILMGGFGGWGVWQEYQSGAYMGFHYPC